MEQLEANNTAVVSIHSSLGSRTIRCSVVCKMAEIASIYIPRPHEDLKKKPRSGASMWLSILPLPLPVRDRRIVVLSFRCVSRSKSAPLLRPSGLDVPPGTMQCYRQRSRHDHLCPPEPIAIPTSEGTEMIVSCLGASLARFYHSPDEKTPHHLHRFHSESINSHNSTRLTPVYLPSIAALINNRFQGCC